MLNNNQKLYFFVLYFIDFSKKSLVFGADFYCDSYYDINKIFHPQVICSAGQFCCGLCKERYCCGDGRYILNQNNCSSGSMSWWVIVLICIAVVYILYCVLRTLKPLCFPTPAVSRSNRVHSVSHARIARLFSNDSTRPNSAPTLPNSRAMSQQTNIPPYGGINQSNYMANYLFQQDNPPPYETLKIKPPPPELQKEEQ